MTQAEPMVRNVSMLDEFRELFAFDRWANQRVLDAAAGLTQEELSRDLGSSFPSVLATLAHILGGEWIWLQRWKGVSPTQGPPWDLSTLPALRERWAEHEADQSAFVDALTPESLEAECAYLTLAGEAYANPLRELLRHLVNHSTYHRGQVVTLLRQLGHAAPSTDLIRFLREQRAAAVA